MGVDCLVWVLGTNSGPVKEQCVPPTTERSALRFLGERVRIRSYH